MVLKSEMEKQNEALTKKVRLLENKVKKLKSKIKEADAEAASMEEVRIQSHRTQCKSAACNGALLFVLRVVSFLGQFL